MICRGWGVGMGGWGSIRIPNPLFPDIWYYGIWYLYKLPTHARKKAPKLAFKAEGP